ncbi:MAG: hypothetical protein WBP12_01650 [Candidatus Saccharimonas sp.]
MTSTRAATMFVVAEPQEGETLPSPEEFLNGRDIYSDFGILRLQHPSNALLVSSGRKLHLNGVLGDFRAGSAEVRVIITGTYSAEVGDTLYLT